MIVIVNGKALTIQDHTTAEALIQQLNQQHQRIALEVNKAIIPKSEQGEFLLYEGDKIEIINAVGGG